MAAKWFGAIVVSTALAGCAGAGGQSEEVRAFCERADVVDQYLNEGAEFGDVSDEDVIAGFEELARTAPERIFPSVDVVREAYTYVVDTGDESVFDEPEVQDASNRFARYLDEECGIG